MLEYMYKDHTDKLEQIPEEILIAADKYGLERLRAQCEAVLCRVKVFFIKYGLERLSSST